MRERAIVMSGKADITIDNIAHALTKKGRNADNMRLSIENLANQESETMLTNPPNTSKTSRVMESREAEARAFSAINAAVVATIENNDKALSGENLALKHMNVQYVNAFQAIDNTPGITYYRRNLKNLLTDQIVGVSEDKISAINNLNDAEKDYLEADADNIFSKYQSLDQDDEFNI